MANSRNASVSSDLPAKDMVKTAHLEMGNEDGHPHELPPDQHKKMFRKIDIRLMPMLAVSTP
jgi:hypothetical protein